jgi:hypothetical protein
MPSRIGRRASAGAELSAPLTNALSSFALVSCDAPVAHALVRAASRLVSTPSDAMQGVAPAAGRFGKQPQAWF